MTSDHIHSELLRIRAEDRRRSRRHRAEKRTTRRLASPSLVLFTCLLASQAGMLVLSPILPELARDLGVTSAAAGQLRSVSGAVGGITAVLLAVMPRRPGLRDLLAAGAALLTAGSLLSAVAPTFALLAGAQAVLGVGVGILVAVGIAAAGEWPAASERPHVLAWAIAGMPVAWIAGMPVVGLLAGISWRAPFVGVPAVAGAVALGLLLQRPADERSERTAGGGAWRRPGVARFAGGELLANAAWASVLTYSGVLLFESYDLTPALVALGLGGVAAAMVPGTFAARKRAAHATPRLLMGLTLFQAAAVAALCGVRPGAVTTFAVLAAMAFVNGWRSMIASAVGMDAAPDDKVAVMSVRAASNQFGYLLGAAAGGLALGLGGFAALGGALAAMFVASVLVHVAVLPRRAMVPQPT